MVFYIFASAVSCMECLSLSLFISYKLQKECVILRILYTANCLSILTVLYLLMLTSLFLSAGSIGPLSIRDEGLNKLFGPESSRWNERFSCNLKTKTHEGSFYEVKCFPLEMITSEKHINQTGSPAKCLLIFSGVIILKYDEYLCHILWRHKSVECFSGINDKSGDL